MVDRADQQRLDRLRRALIDALDDPAVDVRRFREGVDCWVDLVHGSGGVTWVVRSARFERRATRYEGVVDFAELLENEVAVTRLLRDAGIPTPAVRQWHRATDPDGGPSWMLLDYVDHEPVDRLTEHTERCLGRLARRIHAIHPSGEDSDRLSPRGRWGPFMVRRLIDRVDAARRYVDLPPTDALERALQPIFADREEHAHSLLHLDLRPPNLAVDPESGEILAIFDMGNALVGDPLLELGRIRGCDMLTDAFVEGYGTSWAWLGERSLVLDAYELDLAALLVVVSLEEMTDPELHERMTARTTLLAGRIETRSRG